MHPKTPGTHGVPRPSRFVLSLALLLALTSPYAASAAPAPRGNPGGDKAPAAPANPIWAEVKAGACPTNQTTDLGGMSPLLCHKGLGGFEFGTSCIYIVTSKGANAEVIHRDFGCTEACPGPDWKVDIPCASKSDLAAFKGKVYFRNFDALPAATQKQMKQDMATLLALVKAADAKNAANYNSLGGDDKRKAVKVDMVNIVFEQMIPFAWSTRDPSDDVNRNFDTAYSGPIPEGMTGVNPFEWFGGNNFDTHESAFYTRDKSGNLQSEDPNMIAAAQLHEFLIHARQFDRGNGEPVGMLINTARDQANDLVSIENDLSEIVAYTVSLQDPFYRFVLTAAQRNAIGDAQLAAKHKYFNDNWPQLNQPAKEEAAAYAWYCSDYMQSQMTRASVVAANPMALALMGIRPNAGGALSPWTELCSAPRTGVGTCRISNKKPQSDECLKKHYF